MSVPRSPAPPSCGTPTRLSDVTAETREALLDAVREANGRRALRLAKTVDAAALDVESFLVVPEWSAGQRAADVSADALRELYGIEAAANVFTWALYTEGARRLGFRGPVPVPAWSETGGSAQA